MILLVRHTWLLLLLLFDCFLNHAFVPIHTSWLIKHSNLVPLVEKCLEIQFELLPRYVPLSDNFTISFMVSRDPKFKFISDVGAEFNVYSVIRALPRITVSSLDKSPKLLMLMLKYYKMTKNFSNRMIAFKHTAISARFCMQSAESVQYFRHPLYKFRIREDVVLYLLPARSMKYARATGNFISVATLRALRFYSQMH